MSLFVDSEGIAIQAAGLPIKPCNNNPYVSSGGNHKLMIFHKLQAFGTTLAGLMTQQESAKVAYVKTHFIKGSRLISGRICIRLCSVMMYTTGVEQWQSQELDLVPAYGGYGKEASDYECVALLGLPTEASESQSQNMGGISWEMLSLEGALTLLDRGAEQPSVDAFVHLLQECKKKRDFGSIKRLHGHLHRLGLETHSGISSHIISALVDCGNMHSAQQLFDQLTHRNVYIWTSLILGYIECGQPLKALNVYQKMQEDSIYPSSCHTLVALLKACARLKELGTGQDIHIEIMHQGFDKDLFVGSTLIDMYIKCGSFSEAYQVFNKLQDRNVVSWNALIAGYAQLGLSDEVLRCIEAMQMVGISPNAVTFTSALKACCSSVGQVDKVREVHNDVVKQGFDKDLFIMSTLVDVYGKHGSLLEAQEVFDKLPVRDLVAWMALVAGYAEHGPGQGALKCFQQMQEEGVCPDAAIFACVLKACGGIGAIHQGREAHLDAVKRGYEIDPFVSSTLVDVYAKCESVLDARKVFENILDKNVVSWNALLAGYAEHGCGHEALICFQQAGGFLSANSLTFCSVLKALGGMGMITEGRKVHSCATLKGLENELFTGNSLVDMYAKCGFVLEAQKVFDRLKDRSIVSWTVLIAGYAENGPVSKALDCFEEMQSDFITPDSAILACVLKACSSVGDREKGKKVHRLITEVGFERDLLVGNSLVDMYAKCGSVAEAQGAFDKLSGKNVISWTTLIALYVDRGLGQEGLECFEQMSLESVVPDAAIFACALNACSSVLALDKGKDIHKSIIQRGLEIDVIVGSSVVDMYATCGSLLEAQVVFDSIKTQHVASWNALITGYAERGCDREAIKWFDQMQLKGIYSDVVTYVSILKACSGLGVVRKGYELHKEIAQKGFEVDPFVGNTLVHMYAKCGVLLEAQEVFGKLPVKSVVSWNALIAGYAEYGPNHEALTCYEHMQLEGVHQTAVSFTCGLKACGSTGAIDKGREIHKHVIQVGWEADISIGSTLVDMYAKCGSILEAHQVFDKLSARDVVAWNALIKGYGLNHDSDMAVKFFADMQEQGVKPTGVTFLCLLTTCSHNNLVLKGQEFFKMMIEKFDITPALDHFSCMVDLFARSGCLNEAEKFLEALPCFPSKDIWIPLLSACKTYAEVDIGHKCFEQLVHTDPDCAASYVLMSSIYVGVGCWNDVARLEEMQRKRTGSEKKPGTANNIEIDDLLNLQKGGDSQFMQGGGRGCA